MANLIKRIVKAQYETSDGQTFESKVDAMKHQADLDRVRKVMDLLTANLQFRTAGACDYLADSTTVNEVATFIVDNADALREILPKRAKSAEAPAAPAAPAQGVHVGSPLNPIGSLAAATVGVVPQAPVVGGLTVPDSATQPPFSLPAGLVNNVDQQASPASA